MKGTRQNVMAWLWKNSGTLLALAVALLTAVALLMGGVSARLDEDALSLQATFAGGVRIDYDDIRAAQLMDGLDRGQRLSGVRSARILAEQYHIRAALVNCSSVKPMDRALLGSLSDRPLVTMEEHVLLGGFGSAVACRCAEEGWPAPMLMFGIPDAFIPHGSRGQLMRTLGLCPDQMAKRIQAELNGRREHGGGAPGA